MPRTSRVFRSVAASALAAVTLCTATTLAVGPAFADPVADRPADGSATAIVASSAGQKLVGLGTSTWGSFGTSQAITAWTEVKIGGQWQRSQSVTTSSTGYFTIPLTYGTNSAGTYTFRVRGQLPNGTIATSNEFSLKRLALPTAYSAGEKLVGLGTSTWGRLDTNKATTAWTEVNIGGQWHKSQQVTTSSNGSYTIPLTYGTTTPGTYSFRVRGTYADGTVATSKTFTIKRLAQPTANSAGTKPVGQGTSTWGTFDTDRSLTAWTEVNVGGQWHKSQQVTTDRNGNHTIPLTYGATTPGTYTFRVRGQQADGTISTSRQFTLTRTEDKSKAQKAVEFAHAQLGDSYRYGGTGPDGWDCSGLTGGAWKAAGVSLPRTSQQQYSAGKKVSKADLQPGDLVFYYSGRSHVAIYVGNGQIVHASRPGKPVEKVSVNLMPFNGAVRPA